MAAISVTYSFVNGQTSDGPQVSQNFTDIVSGLSDGTKDLTISAITCSGNATFNGTTNTIGNAASDTLTVNATITSNLIATDATYDIGASGATRFRDLFLSRNIVNGGTIVASGSATATAFIPSGATVPTNGMYLIGSNNVGIAINSTKLIDISAGFVDIVRATAGDVTLRIANSDTTNTSDAKLTIQTASSAAGDPQVTFTAVGHESFTIGLDTSATVLAISNATALGTNRWEMDTSGNITSIGYRAISANADPGAPTNSIRIGAMDTTDTGAPRTIHLRTEQAVEAIGTFTASHKLRVWINNVEYWIQLDAV